MNTNSYKKILLLCGVLSLSAFALSITRFELKEAKAELVKEIPEQKPLYLPKVEKVKAITLGFDQMASDVIWFNTLNYFGKQVQSRKDIPWFANMCDLVTSLDKQGTHVYEFCSTLLSWIAKEPNMSVKLLNRAIENNPNHWRYYYIRGFTYWYFLEDKAQAAEDLKKAAKLPDAPLFLSSLASRLMVSESTPGTAISFLKELIHQSKDPNAKKALSEKLKKAYVSRDLLAIQKQIDIFEDSEDRKPTKLEELVNANLLKYIPKDPFGDTYYIDEKGKPLSVTAKNGLAFNGKNAKTGLAKWK